MSFEASGRAIPLPTEAEISESAEVCRIEQMAVACEAQAGYEATAQKCSRAACRVVAGLNEDGITVVISGNYCDVRKIRFGESAPTSMVNISELYGLWTL